MGNLKFVCLILLCVSVVNSSLAMDKPREEKSPLALLFRGIQRTGDTPGPSRRPTTQEKYSRTAEDLKKIASEKEELATTLPKLKNEALTFESEADKLKREALNRKAEVMKYNNEAEQLNTKALEQKSQALQFKEQAEQHTHNALLAGTATGALVVAAVLTGGGSTLLGLEAYAGKKTLEYSAQAKMFSDLASRAERESNDITSQASAAKSQSEKFMSLAAEADNKSQQLSHVAHDLHTRSGQCYKKIEDLNAQEVNCANQRQELGQMIAYQEIIMTAQGQLYTAQTVSFTNFWALNPHASNVSTGPVVPIDDGSLDKLCATVEEARRCADYTRRSLDSARHAVEEAFKVAESAQKKATFSPREIFDLEEDEPNVVWSIVNADSIAGDAVTRAQSLESDLFYARQYHKEALHLLACAEINYQTAYQIANPKMISNVRIKEVYKKINLIEQNDPNFKKVRLIGHGINEAVLSDFCRALQKNSFLRELNLDSNEITDLGAEWIFLALQNNTSLSKLSLMDNQLTNRSVDILANFLGNNKTLREIDISGPHIADSKIEKLNHLFPAIKINSVIWKDKTLSE